MRRAQERDIWTPAAGTSVASAARAMRLLLFLCALALLACSGAPGAPLVPGSPVVDRAPALRGVPDRGADPAVVLLDVAGRGPCTGALLADDVVLTARRCVELTRGDPACPASAPQVAGPRDPSTIHVLVGDDAAAAIERARGRGILVPPGDVLCRADVAFLLLDAPIDDVAPFAVSATGAALGDHVRSVSFGDGAKRVRDHVPVTGVTDREIEIAEAPCAGTPGGPAIDESTGEVVGVLSRGGPACGDVHGWDVATRPDAFFSLVEQAFAQGHTSHATGKAKEKKGAVDMGASCARGSDCAAGVCVSYVGAQYCSRLCSPTDRCPARWRCMESQQSTRVCVEE